MFTTTFPQPQININPTSLNFSLSSSDTANAQLTISNIGTSDLLWSVGNFDTATVRAKIESVVQELRKQAEAPTQSHPISQSKEENISYSWSKETAINVVFKKSMDISLRNVALLAADDPTYASDVQQKLIATGMFNSVTIIDARSIIPTVNQLKTFDAILVWSANSFADTQMIGDNLADYIDAGGGVVTAVYAGTSQSVHMMIRGRFNSQNYWVITPGWTHMRYSSTLLGTIHNPDHPVMRRVSTFDGGYYSICYSSWVEPGGVSIADWADGFPLIAERKIYGVNRIDLGFYPPSSSVYQYYWDANTDGAIIMANALCYVGVKFVKLDPTSGNIAAGGNQTVNVNVNSKDLYGGNYQNTVTIESNDPVTPQSQVLISLDVAGTPNIVLSVDTLIFTQGYVGYPDTAYFTISNDGNDLLNITNIQSNNSEFVILDTIQFSIAPNHTRSIGIIYTRMSAEMITGILTISSDDPDNSSVNVVMKGSAVYPPVINLTPSLIPEVVINIGDSTSRLLTLSNNGGSDLKFNTKFISPESDSLGVRIMLPITLYDALDFTWDLDKDGGIKYGTNNVFNGGFDLSYFGNYYDSASTEESGREVVIGPYSNIYEDIYRKIFIPKNASFIRYLEIFKNKTSEDRRKTVEMTTHFGHHSTDYYAITSSGDQNFGMDDNWIVVRDSTRPEVPAFVDVFVGAGGILQPNYIYGGPPNSNYITYRWYVNIPAGETFIIMHFGAQRWSQQEGIAVAEELMNLEGEALRGMSVEEMSLVKNFKAQKIFAVSPDSATVHPDSSEELSVGYNGKNVASGNYKVNLRFLSNDPTTPIKDVPISLKVQGYPHISVSKDTMNFGQGLVGYPDTLVFRIYNNGNAALNILGVTTSNPEFVILDSTTFVIDFNLWRDVRIQCKRSIVTSWNEDLTITSNDTSHPLLIIPLSAVTVNLPVISVYPDTLGFSLLRGDTAKGSFIISNTGLSDLRWHVRNFPRSNHTSISESLDVALIAADDLNAIQDVRNRLLLTNRFRSITIIQANITTPTLAQLRDFDAVLVWSGGQYFANKYTLGDNLASYIDEGGGVVIASESGVSSSISGRFEYNSYWVMTSSSNPIITGDANLGTVYEPGHPLMKGVNSLYAECPKKYISPTLLPGSIRIADWTDGSPLIAERKIKGVNRVDLNLYPPSSTVNNCYWDFKTDGANIIANALSYVGRKIVITNPSYGTTAAGSSDSVTLIVDTRGLAAGEYDHRFVIESNDPLNNDKHFAVGISVTGNPEISINPNSFAFSLHAGDSAIGLMNIKNLGTSNLEWRVEGIVRDTANAKIIRVVEEMRRAVEEKMASGELPKGDANTLLNFTPETAVSVMFSENHKDGAINALLIYYDAWKYAMDVRNKLLSTGIFNSITLLMEYYGTPTVAQLQSFDAVMVWSWGASFLNPETLGNNLADYIDSGGGVVMSYYTGQPAQYGGIVKGRFSDENYWVIAPSIGKGTQAFLGKIYQSDHPIMRNVHSFNGGNSLRYTGGIVEGGARIADWSDGTPLIAEKTINGVSRIDLGFYPPSSTAYQYGWVDTTDGALIIANALKYVAKKYTSLVPSTGIIIPGDSQNVSVKIKTDDLIERVYNSTLNITCNDTVHPSVGIPVTLTLTGFPAISADSNALNFGIVYEGSSDTLSLNIINTGTGTLSISDITSASSRYSVLAPTSFSIPPRGGHIIRVAFTPSGPGVQSSTITIFSNALNNPDLNIALIGNGIMPPELATPPNQSTNISHTERLTWHPAFFAAKYHLQVAKDSLFTIIIINDSTIIDTTSIMPSWEVGTMYYWRVKAISPLAVSGWSDVWKFTTKFSPDLIVSEIQLPSSVYSGQSFEVLWIVTNVGAAGTNTPFWSDAIWLFPDSVINFSTAIHLGSSQNATYLNAGESYANKATFTLPRGITGTYYIFVITDQDNRLSEFNEENNRLYNNMQVNLTPPPDLRVVSIVAPENAFSGDSIDVMWSVKNLGTGSTVTGQWWDGFYISPDSIFNNSSAHKVYEKRHIGILLPDSGYSTYERIMVPNTIWGKYYLFIRTDDHNEIYENVWESNNISRTDSLIITLSPPPDLVVTDMQIPPTGNSGQPITIQWSVQNQGPGSPFESGWSDRIYISRVSSFILDSCVSLGTITFTGKLEPESTYTKLATVTIPNGYSGPYYIYVMTDWNNQVFEYIYEDNNILKSTSTLAVNLTPWPDLETISLNVPMEITAGQKVTIGWVVKNSGDGLATIPWIDNIYLSDTASWFAPRAKLLRSKLHSLPLAPNQTQIETSLVTIGTDIYGSYYIYLFVDANNSIYENTDEGNNIFRSTEITINPYPPVDLVVKNVSVDTTGSSGQPIRTKWTIQNIGSAKTLSSIWIDELYISIDTIFDGSDIKIGSFSHSGELGPNETYSRDLTVTIPNGIQGNYYLLIIADAHLSVKEVNENNNTGYSPEKINIRLTPSPDFIVSDVTSPSQAQAGQPINLTWTVTNSGLAGNLVNTWSDGIYLSADTNYSPHDLRLGTISQTGTLHAGQSYTDSLTVTVPIYLSGNFYLIFCTDIASEIYEHQTEYNNWKAVPITITMPPPSDLIVTNIEIPDTVECGTDITITWTLRNTGLYNATGWMYDAVYISSDTIWNVEDPIFGISYRYIDLAPGTSARFSIKTDLIKIFKADSLGEITSEIPGVSIGNYHAIVRTDIRNNIRESNDQNNSFASNATMNVNVPEIHLNTPMNTTLMLNQLRYYRVDVGDHLDLKLSLTSNVSSVSNEVYISYDKAPTFNDFDYSATIPFTSDQELVVPSTRAGTYYLLIIARSFPVGANNENVTLLATALPFSITGITPNHGGLGGKVTCVLNGAGFRDGIKLYLKDNKDSLYESEIVRFINTTEVKLRWDLEDIPLGTYDIVAKNPDNSTVYLASGFIVEPLNRGEIYFTHTIPDALPGRLSSMYTIQFAHTWNIDLPYLSVVIALSAPQKVDVSSDRFKSFKSFVPETLKSKTLPYFDSDDWRIIPLTARDIIVGEVVQINLSLLQIMFEHHRAPIKIIAYGMDKKAYIENINMQTDIARQLILDNSSIMDSGLVNLAQDYQTFSDSVKGFMINNNLIEPEDFINIPKKSIIPMQIAKTASTQQSGPKVCTLVCTLTGCAAAGIDCLLGGPLTAPSCVFGLTVSCGFPMAGMDAGLFSCVGVVSLINCLVCYSLCPAIYQAVDPNDIIGPSGYGDLKWIANTETLPYTIRFENDPEKADAPAKTVIVKLQLDSSFDIRTFRLGNFGFGSFFFDVPSNKAFYSKRIDVRDSLGVYVDFNAGIDLAKNEAFWILKSIDPNTGQIPTDPLLGFLLVNDSLHHGEGFINFTIKPKPTLSSGERIHAQASIVFDVNETINTPDIFNTIDADKPLSRVYPLPQTNSTTFEVAWTGSDSCGSGIKNYTIYVSVNDSPYSAWLTDVTDTSAVFSGILNNKYAFYSIARDNVGNIEESKSLSDTYTIITGIKSNGELPKEFTLFQNYPNPFNPSTTISYQLPIKSNVTLKVYDLLGRVVATIVDEKKEAGKYSLEFNASDYGISSGVYFYKISASGESKIYISIKKLLFLK